MGKMSRKSGRFNHELKNPHPVATYEKNGSKTTP